MNRAAGSRPLPSPSPSPRPVKAWRYLGAHGPVATARYAAFRLYEDWNDRRLNIRTCGYRRLSELGIRDEALVDYGPTEYRGLRRVLRRLEVRAGEDVLLDYGCGMGRVLVCAAAYPFRRIVGIEIAPELGAIALDNLRRSRGRRICPDSRVEIADARSYPVAPDVTVAWMHHPFEGAALRTVLERLRESVEAAPRRITVVYKNAPAELDRYLTDSGWLAKVGEVPSALGRGFYICRNDGRD